VKNVRVFLAAILGLLLCAPVFSDEKFEELAEKAKAGDAEAQLKLGNMYADGTGVPLDKTEAVKWFNLAAATGSEKSAKGRDLLAKRMTKEQIAEGQKLSREWLERKAKENGE
jgi:TPR repeat protein